MSVYETARMYDKAGLCVIPILANGTKRPAVKWQDYETCRPTAGAIEEWFNGPPRGIAIICGPISGNIEALDFDAPGAMLAWYEKCKQAGLKDLVRSCVLVETPSKGNHIYYRLQDAPPGNTKLAHTIKEVTEGTSNAREIGGHWFLREVLIETRGTGGYCVAPGSPLECHNDRRPYTLKHGSFTALPILTADERRALHDVAISFDEPLPEVPRPPRSTRPTNIKPAVQSAALTPWEDFDRRVDVRSIVQKHGWTLTGNQGTIEHWTRPGKDAREGHSATIGYCESDGIDLFYPFTSNAYPFEAGEAYGPFRAYVLLEHGTDPDAPARAAKALYAEGYGDRQQSPRERGREQLRRYTSTDPGIGDKLIQQLKSLERPNNAPQAPERRDSQLNTHSDLPSPGRAVQLLREVYELLDRAADVATLTASIELFTSACDLPTGYTDAADPFGEDSFSDLADELHRLSRITPDIARLLRVNP